MMTYSHRLEENSLAIFLFHGVVDHSEYEVRNYNRKHISRQYFIEVLSDLKDKGTAISIEDAVELMLHKEAFPKRSFAVTFDDGFYNNYQVAAPILRNLNIPAAFYITTDFIDNNRMSWIDRIEYCCETVRRGTVVLPWEKKSFTLDSREEKITFLEYLRRHVKRNASIDTERLVTDVFEQCDLKEVLESDDPIDLKMSWNDIKELQGEPLFTIGGHTHNHANLGFLNKNDLFEEISHSINLIKERVGIKVRHYSYPEGLEYCFNQNVIDTLKRFGIICCPTAIDGTNLIDEDLFYLKRIAVI